MRLKRQRFAGRSVPGASHTGPPTQPGQGIGVRCPPNDCRFSSDVRIPSVSLVFRAEGKGRLTVTPSCTCFHRVPAGPPRLLTQKLRVEASCPGRCLGDSWDCSCWVDTAAPTCFLPRAEQVQGETSGCGGNKGWRRPVLRTQQPPKLFLNARPPCSVPSACPAHAHDATSCAARLCVTSSHRNEGSCMYTRARRGTTHHRPRRGTRGRLPGRVRRGESASPFRDLGESLCPHPGAAAPSPTQPRGAAALGSATKLVPGLAGLPRAPEGERISQPPGGRRAAARHF